MSSNFLWLPRVAQKLDFTCGAACVRSALLYLKGIQIDEDVISKEIGIDEKGYTVLEHLLRFLEKQGIKAHSSYNNKQGDIEDALSRREIVMVSFFDDEVGHYGLIKGSDDLFVTLMDPWVARENHDNVMTWEEFQQRWYYRGEYKTYLGHAIRIFK